MSTALVEALRAKHARKSAARPLELMRCYLTLRRTSTS